MAPSSARVSFMRDVQLAARTSMDELRSEVSIWCSPIDTTVELLNSHTCEQGEFWTVRVELFTNQHALSRRKAHALVEAIEAGREPRLPLAVDLPEPAPRRPGWTVWFHKVEPSVEEFLSLVARPVARAEVDRTIVWPRIRDLLVDAISAVAPELRVRPSEERGGNQFALLGFDVLLDQGLRPWLCEINANPTLEARRPVDRDVDLEVIGDLLLLLEGGTSDRLESLTEVARAPAEFVTMPSPAVNSTESTSKKQDVIRQG
eukprot:TRINITY_DN23881_c0_g2_i2.p1 TRINITY_DN23881_c0_g2~~TRINITY_DN23881_c0_g2_i2.p1  ORF type:complete len:270 (+),score=57.62 TRINITY_DN23881_c0_g2_i2:30-812(+)